MSLEELKDRIDARLLPRGQLELRVNEELPDRTVRILTVCEFGGVPTLAAASAYAAVMKAIAHASRFVPSPPPTARNSGTSKSLALSTTVHDSALPSC